MSTNFPLISPVLLGPRGHFIARHKCALVATQAANSRIFELRNTGTGFIVLTSLCIKWLQTAAHTAAIEDSLDLFKCTSFSAVDTVATVTPTPSVKRGDKMIASPGNVAVRGVTVAGAAAGMSGGTLTKNTDPFFSMAKWLLLAVPTASEVKADVMEVVSPNMAEHPFVFGVNEGFIIENSALLGAAAGSSVYIECEYVDIEK